MNAENVSISIVAASQIVQVLQMSNRAGAEANNKKHTVPGVQQHFLDTWQ